MTHPERQMSLDNSEAGNLSIPDLLELICLRQNIKTDAGRRALTRALANVELLNSKQQDYGSRNISDFGEFGVIVRLNDKLQRMINLRKKQNSRVTDDKEKFEANHESILDTWQDISNYGLIGQMLHEQKWPDE